MAISKSEAAKIKSIISGSSSSSSSSSSKSSSSKSSSSKQTYDIGGIKVKATSEKEAKKLAAEIAGDRSTSKEKNVAEVKEKNQPVVDPYAGALNDLLNNQNLSDDQKKMAQEAYNIVSKNDKAKANRLLAGFQAGLEYSSPYFKAQAAIVTKSLSEALISTDGDLSFKEKQIKNTLDELTANIAASKDYLDFTQTKELQDLAKTYQQELENTQQELAATGKTSSSVRTKAESMLNQQNEGLVQSTQRKFSYQTGNLDRQFANEKQSRAQELQYLKDKATQERIAKIRQAEEQVGSKALQDLGYDNLIGGVGGQIPQAQVKDALSYAGSFVF